MSPVERNDLRKIWITVLSGVALMILSQVFNIPERVSGMNSKIDRLELTKMNTEDANHFFSELQVLMAEQCSKWDQYMISNEKDKERILEEIETINKDIKAIISKSEYKITRGVSLNQ